MPAPHAGMHGLAWPELFFPPIIQLFIFLSFHSVYSDNVTPPPSGSKTCVGQEKLSYHTHKSNIHCLHCDNARSHYQSGVIRMFCKYRMRRLLSTDICCQCLLLTTMQRLGIGLSSHLILGCFLILPQGCVQWRELCWLCRWAVAWADTAGPVR